MPGGDVPRSPPWIYAASAGSSLVGSVVLGVLLDWQFGWTPWATLTGVGLGLLTSVMVLLRAAKQSQGS